MLKCNLIIKSFIATVVLLFLFPQKGEAQRWKLRRYEVGVGLGTIQVFGDIGGTASTENWFGLKDIKFDETRLAFTSQGRYKFNHKYSVKGNLNLGFGRGSDEDSRNDRGRSYKTTLIEFSGQIEHYFLAEDKRFRSAAIHSRRGMINNYNTLAAYTFVGLGVTYAISKHADAPILSMDEYRSGGNFIPVIPFGIGLKYILDDRTYVNGELGYRWAIMDYIDGYKQTSASKHNDVYYFLTFSLNYRLKTSRRNIPAFMDKKLKKYGY